MGALPAKVDSLEGIGEQFHPLYAPITEDGKDEPIGYKLAVEIEGMIPEEQVTGLERNRDEILTELKTLKGKFKGVDPEKFIELQKREKQLERDRMEKEGDFAALESQLREQHDEDTVGLRETIGKYNEKIQDLLVTQVATQEIAAAKGKVAVLLPHVQNRVRCIEETEGSADFRVEVLGENGRPKLGSKGNPMTIAELVEEMKDSDDFAVLFEGSGATGGGSTGSRGTAPSGAVVLKGDQRKDTRAYAAAKAEAEKRGVPFIMQE